MKGSTMVRCWGCLRVCSIGDLLLWKRAFGICLTCAEHRAKSRKKCNSCGRTLPEEAYGRQGSRKRGICLWCAREKSKAAWARRR